MSEEMKMRIAGIEKNSIVDGPGLRCAVFAQGCPHRCDGCHNPQTWDESGGSETSVQGIISGFLSDPLLSGITLTGGEPFMQPGACLMLASAAKAAGLSVWAYTGYIWERLTAMPEASPERKLLKIIDVLVDGPFEADLKTFSARWRGSSNQRVIDVQASLRCNTAVELAV